MLQALLHESARQFLGRATPMDSCIYSGQLPPPTVSPPERVPIAGTEEDWQRRLQKRLNAVASTKATAEYAVYLELRARGELPTAHPPGAAAGSENEGPPAPRTPVTNDRTISKRGWEDKVRQWRSSLRDLCPVGETNGATSTTASTDLAPAGSVGPFAA